RNRMVMIRRELPRTEGASWRPGSLSQQFSRGFSFRRRPISSVGQRRPDKAGELAGDRGDDMLFRFATGGESLIAAIETLLRAPGGDPGRFRSLALASAQLFADEGVVPIVPRGFDEDAAHMSIARLGDRPRGAPRSARVLGGNQADVGHQAPRGGEPPRVPQ